MSPPPSPPTSSSSPPAAPPAAPPPPTTAAKPVYTYRGEGMSWYQAPMWNTGRSISRLLSLIIFRFRVYGLENLPSKKAGPALLVTNHQSFLDPWLLGIGPGRQIHFMARDTLFTGRFKRWLMETLNSFPVKRGQGDRASIRMAYERLDKGYIVNIFPEGTRSLDGTIGPIAPGMALILRGCKRPVPVIPVVIDGALEAWHRDQKMPHPHPIRIIHGQPITPEEIKAMSADELAQRVRRELVALQAKVGSVHAEASARRLAQDNSPERVSA